MNVTKISVSAGRTFNHPFERFSNFRPGVTLEAEVGPGEDYQAAAKTLQAKAEGLAEDLKQATLGVLDRNMRKSYQRDEDKELVLDTSDLDIENPQ